MRNTSPFFHSIAATGIFGCSLPGIELHSGKSSGILTVNGRTNSFLAKYDG